MDDFSGKNGDVYPLLLDLISTESREECMVKRVDERSSHGHGDEKKLELSLGPPGGVDHWTIINDKNTNTSKNHSNNNNNDLFSFGYFSSSSSSVYQSKAASFYQQLQSSDKKPFPLSSSSAAATAVANISQKRTAPAPVVGWPPIRSFRKNLASSSSSSLKSAPDSPNGVVQNKVESKKPIDENSQKGMFVKINMDCIPIGRKVDLNVYDSYEKLSSAVDQLFRGLLAAQSDSSAGGTQNKDEGERPKITGLLDGSGEYTLVYEDNEGDRMLVGDVPWHMFISTVKRLRVLKSSELHSLSRESKHGNLSL